MREKNAANQTQTLSHFRKGVIYSKKSRGGGSAYAYNNLNTNALFWIQTTALKKWHSSFYLSRLKTPHYVVA